MFYFVLRDDSTEENLFFKEDNFFEYLLIRDVTGVRDFLVFVGVLLLGLKWEVLGFFVKLGRVEIIKFSKVVSGWY